MFKKQKLITLICISIAMMCPTIVKALTCPSGMIHSHVTVAGWTTTYCNGKKYTGSVHSEESVIILPHAAVNEGDRVNVYFDPSPAGYSDTDLSEFIALCHNNGNTSSLSPGIQVIQGSANLAIMKSVPTWTPIRGPQVSISLTDIVAEWAGYLNNTGQNAAVCPNGNWTVVASVPCSFDLSIAYDHSYSSLEFIPELYQRCTLDDPNTPTNECFTLGYSIATNGNANFDRRYFNCSNTTPPPLWPNYLIGL